MKLKRLYNLLYSQLNLLIVLIVCFSSFNLSAQDRTLDSLNVILKNSKNDTTTCKTLISISEYFYYSNPDTVIPICKEVIKIVDGSLLKANNKERRSLLISKGGALNNIGVVEGEHGNHINEIKYLQQSLAIQTELKSKIDIGACYGNLGLAYNYIGDVQKAIDYYLKALKIQEQINDKEGQALNLNNIGQIYVLQKDPQKALSNFKKGYDIMKEIKNKGGEAILLSGIANIYDKFGDPDCHLTSEECLYNGQKLALGLHKKCFELEKEIDNKSGMAYSLNNIAISYKKIGNPDSKKSYNDRMVEGRELALNYLKQSLQILECLDSKKGIANIKDNIANLLLQQGKISEAKIYSEQSLNMAKTIGVPDQIMRSATTLKQILKKQGNAKDAFEMFALEIAMRDSISNQENKKALFQKNLKYEYDKKVLADSLAADAEIKTADLKLQKEKATKNNLIITTLATIAILIILFFLVFSLLKNIKQRKKAYINLQEKNIEIQHQSQKLVELSKQITKYQTQMNPHFVFNALNSIQGFVVNNEKEKTLIQLQNFSKLMRNTLNNSANETITLKTELDFLKLYVDFEKEKFGKNIEFNIKESIDAYDLEIPPMLIQPLLENCLKHAGFHHIEKPKITLTFTEVDTLGLLNVEVCDNGSGIIGDVEDVYNKSHALSILKSRLNLIFEQNNLTPMDKNIIIQSNNKYIKQGTSIGFYLPLIYKY